MNFFKWHTINFGNIFNSVFILKIHLFYVTFRKWTCKLLIIPRMYRFSSKVGAYTLSRLYPAYWINHLVCLLLQYWCTMIKNNNSAHLAFLSPIVPERCEMPFSCGLYLFYKYQCNFWTKEVYIVPILNF